MIDIETDELYERAERIAWANGRPRNLNAITDRISLRAVVDAGRWIVHCPCGSARMAKPSVLMWCPDCGNEYCGSAQVVVQFPDEHEMLRIDAALSGRVKHLRGWEPGETIEHLLEENEGIA